MLFVARESHMVNGTPTATGRTRDIEAPTLREAVVKLRASELDPDCWRINASGTGMINVTTVKAPVAWYVKSAYSADRKLQLCRICGMYSSRYRNTCPNCTGR